MVIKFQDINEAKELLNLPDRASMAEIKAHFRELISRWHPDTCKESESAEKCNEMTRKIIAAYNTIIIYCNQYKYSFEKEEVERYSSDEDWWFKRFGNDPLWGKNDKP